MQRLSASCVAPVVLLTCCILSQAVCPAFAVGCKSAQMAAVVEHAVAIKSLFRVVAGNACMERTMQVQIRSLAVAIDSTSFTLAEAIAAAEELKGLPEAAMLTAKVMERIAAPAASTTLRRVGLQDFTNIIHYMTEAQWDFLESEHHPSHAKLEKLLVATIMLGGRNLNETTMQLLCGLHLLLAEGKAKAASLAPSVKLEMARSLKAKFKSILARLQQTLPAGCIERLPLATSEYRDSYPLWWAFAFETPPVPSRISTSDLHAMMSSVPMRGTRQDISSKAASSSSVAAPDAMQMMQQMFAMARSMQPLPPDINLQLLPKPSERRCFQRLESRLALCDAPVERQQPAPECPGEVQQPAPAAEQPPVAASAPDGSIKMGVIQATQAVAAALVVKKAEKATEAGEAAPKAKGKATKAKAKAKGQATAKAKAKAKAKPQQSEGIGKKPNWGRETTRSQLVCRTGFTGSGQCYIIKYEKGNGKNGLAAAEKKANEWVAGQMKKRKFA
jgi:hypothetical protein